MTTSLRSPAMPDRAPSNGIMSLLAMVLLTTLVLSSLMATAISGLPASAGAHAELIEASPDRSTTVGGTFDEVALQFVGLAHPGEHEILILDPLGNTIEILDFEQDFNLLTVAITPLTVEGEYIVSYQTDGIDNDLTTGSYTFTFDADADAPAGISHEQQTPGVDWVTVGLIVTTALAFLGWLAYVINRLRAPLPEAETEVDEGQSGADALDESVDRDQVSHEDEGLAGPDVGWDSLVTKRKIGRNND